MFLYLIRGLAEAETVQRLFPQQRDAHRSGRPTGSPRPAQGLRGQLCGHCPSRSQLPSQIRRHQQPRVSEQPWITGQNLNINTLFVLKPKSHNNGEGCWKNAALHPVRSSLVPVQPLCLFLPYKVFY